MPIIFDITWYVWGRRRSFLVEVSVFITPILKSLVIPVIWLALIGTIYSRIAPSFALNRIFFPANEATLTTKQPIKFQGLFKVTNQIAGKWKTKSIMWQILQLLFPKLLFLSPKKWMNLISNQLSTASIKYLNWPSPVFGRFQNNCNKVVIEPHVVQFCNLHSTQLNHLISFSQVGFLEKNSGESYINRLNNSVFDARTPPLP